MEAFADPESDSGAEEPSDDRAETPLEPSGHMNADSGGQAYALRWLPRAGPAVSTPASDYRPKASALKEANDCALPGLRPKT